MIQRFTAQFPVWMRPEHPVLRYTLGNPPQETMRTRATRVIGISLLLGIFIGSGYLIASDFLLENPLDRPLTQMLSDIMFWPTFVLQVILQIGVLVMTIGTIGEEKRRQTWDSLKTTSYGASLALQTRWSAVLFYRLRGFLGLLLIVRLILIGGMLYDLTAFRGQYLNLLIGPTTLEVSLPVGVLLLALMMTASLLLPITNLGFDASFGLLVSTFVEKRTYIALTQIVLVVVRLAAIGLLLLAVTQFRTDTLDATELGTWLILAGFAAIGDWGISFLFLTFYGEIWANIPYGILIGLALVVFALVQAALTDAVLALAIRRAEKSER